MSTGVTVDREGTVTGNTYDKYGSTNPVVKRLMARFEGTLEALFTEAAPRTVLDVGCGEGVLTHQWAQKPAVERIVGIDLDDPALHEAWKERQAPNLEYRVMKAENLPFADGEFDMASAIEVLEHVPDPEHTLSEMARVAGRRCWSASRASRCGAGSTWPAGRTSRSSATRPATSTTGPAAASSSCSVATARSSRRARRSPGPCSW